MKTHTTTTLQYLVLECLAPNCPELSDEEIEDWMERLPCIRQDMLQLMNFALFGSFGNKLVKRHMVQICKECTLMLDALHGYPDFPERMIPLYQQVLDCLGQILMHQQEHYAQYLDPLAKMPLIYYHKAAEAIEAKVEALVIAMTRYYADKTLQSLVVGKMTGLLKNGSGSWQQINCLENLQEKIMDLCIGRSYNMTSGLKDLLIRLNFNTPGFLAYCKESIVTDLDKDYELNHKYNFLFHCQREFTRLTKKYDGVRLEPSFPKIKDSLLEFVTAELACLDRKRRLETVVIDPLAPTTFSRLPVSISVDVLAYFFKLLVKVRVVMPSGKSGLMLFISKSFQTPGIKNAEISPKSLESKYRQVTKSTAVAIRSILVNMLNQVDEEFG
ncbi:hypothetical protein SAMN04487898_105191 [Pedobacter sp. ok626]|uniref:hypothetical protein n=1 Tax=Pedobacter sp. ok626 TaxID=1761882 RepID=UPI0008888C63|nr:hypothetical protein [Pedobacter sp. ok626]SDJ97510.1 hypothetical protein SAMN04487898_105191 [Pedobacter sp. ok626]